MGQNLAPEKITSILEEYSPPENCSEVIVTRVNPEIWASLNAAQRKADLRMATLQLTFCNVCYGYDNRRTLGHEK